MTAQAIERGIAIPPGHRQGNRGGRPHPNPLPAKYPFLALEAGDSFFVAPKEGETTRLIRLRLLNSSTAQRARSMGRRFASRDVQEAGRAGIRVWRVA